MKNTTPTNPTTKWAWCPSCASWVGSEPFLVPPFWSNEKAAWMHRRGTGHNVRLVALDDLQPQHAAKLAA